MGLNFRSLSTSVASLLIILSVAACGGSSKNTDTTTPSTDTSGSAQVTTLTKTDTVVGTGATATSGNTLTVNYTGWLYDVKAVNFKGTKFDSSVDRGTPFQFKLGFGQVIGGWDVGIAGMKVGGKRTLIIPSNLGYGAAGNGSIPANAALVFDVELISIP